MDMQSQSRVFVKTYGPYFFEARETLNAGSVVPLPEEVAEEFVKRGLGEFHTGPSYKAPAAHSGGTKRDGRPMKEFSWPGAPAEAKAEPAPAQAEAPAPVEHADREAKLAKAERAVSRPMQQL